MKANSDKSKQSNKATRRVLAGVLCGASVLSLVLSLVMPPISQAIANDDQTGAAVETVANKNAGAGENVLGEEAGLVTTLRVARAKTPSPRVSRPTTRRPRATRSLRMMVPTAMVQSHSLQEMNRLIQSTVGMNSARSFLTRTFAIKTVLLLLS